MMHLVMRMRRCLLKHSPAFPLFTAFFLVIIPGCLVFFCFRFAFVFASVASSVFSFWHLPKHTRLFGGGSASVVSSSSPSSFSSTSASESSCLVAVTRHTMSNARA